MLCVCLIHVSVWFLCELLCAVAWSGLLCGVVCLCRVVRLCACLCLLRDLCEICCVMLYNVLCVVVAFLCLCVLFSYAN